ncbi:immunoglobulin superfamily member 1-like [Alligator sinensis]|uniref:immunoglobulin superfamily member 1-like n=1 Tax=Alligator sinensis TaxID=38654 RepID=UPI0003C2B70C|nr:immunoglobulin superfamily member 1-like [Alligator sinensis]
MELTLLLPLLASLQIHLQLVSPAGPPSAPSLFLSPVKQEYLLGDTISLECSVPASTGLIKGFQFYGTSGWAVDIAVSIKRFSYIYKFNITGMRDGGSHTCTYSTRQAGKLVRSQTSNSITIKLKDPPPQPKLSVDPPSRVVAKGYLLVLTCTAPEDVAERRFHFYKDSNDFVPEDTGTDTSTMESGTESSKAAVLKIPQAIHNITGQFSCGYEEKMMGRWIPSFRSQAVNITVQDPPSQPMLSMDPPSGVVSEGHPLLITCVAPEEEGKFHFYKDGSEIVPGDAGAEINITDARTDPKNSSVLSISEAQHSDAGEFSCGYEAVVGGRWIPSPKSQPVTITVKDAPRQPTLTVNPQSGEVSKGQKLVITCLVPGNAEERKFHFYKDGREVVSGGGGTESVMVLEDSSRNSSVLSISQAGTSSTGDFTCAYEENVSGRWIASPRSQTATVTLTVWSLSVPLLAGCAAAVGLILLILLVVYLYRRRSGARWRGLRNKDDPSSYAPIFMSQVNQVTQ